MPAASLATSPWSPLSCFAHLWDSVVEQFIPGSLAGDPEGARRARFICRFGFLGVLFGAVYAAFYLLIGHTWGSLVIVICSSGFGMVPLVMKRTQSLNIAANGLLLILILGFFGLCCLEGGVRGHAIAWLASVPLCALLLLGRTGAGRWMLASVAACALIAGLNFRGIATRPSFDPKWDLPVSAAGYLGFILFMFILGVIFESGRRRALNQMQEAYSKLETSNAELIRLNQEKNEFLGIAAHDLKNPLSVIALTADLLRGCQDEKRKEKLIGNIVGASTRMLSLVKDLLDANAIDEGRVVWKMERCDSRALIHECLENNSGAARGKEIRLEHETECPCWIKVDRSAMLQILDNLISNAVKYSPLRSTVRIRTAVQGEVGVVTIRDEGPGLSEQDLKKMFGRFTRLSAKPTGGESSNGLGLSIVKRLTEAMGGTVRCESQLGSGATFILNFPSEKQR